MIRHFFNGTLQICCNSDPQACIASAGAEDYAKVQDVVENLLI